MYDEYFMCLNQQYRYSLNDNSITIYIDGNKYTYPVEIKQIEQIEVTEITDTMTTYNNQITIEDNIHTNEIQIDTEYNIHNTDTQLFISSRN